MVIIIFSLCFIDHLIVVVPRSIYVMHEYLVLLVNHATLGIHTF